MRGEERIPLKVTPKKLERAPERGIIGVALNAPNKMVSTGTAIKLAVEKPPLIVRDSLLALWDAVTTGDAEFAGPKTIVEEGAKAANRGVSDWLNFLGVLSAYLGAFNLVPFPALDGGRLVFLGYELATRRRPNAQMEAQIHLVGLLMLLSLMVWVTVVKGR
ncbi:MAG: RIP metalloprotease [Myxococcota bacterium]